MQWLKSLLGLRDDADHLFAPVPPNPVQDTLAAIEDLSRAMKNNQGAVEIGSALGNIHRLRGELDHAIRIRAALLHRADLLPEDRARIYFELGRDYSRAGILDRARHAFDRYREAGGDTRTLTLELALLSVKSGDFLAASRHYHDLGLAPQAAHYLVRAAGEKDGGPDQGLILEARELYPASPEAWLESVGLSIRRNDWDAVLRTLEEGLPAIGTHLAFLLLDPLFDHDQDATTSRSVLPANRLDEALAIIGRQPQNLSLIHYAGCLLRAHDRMAEATTWQEKALLLNPAFWPARIELLTMALPEQRLTPVFELQLEFLLRRARQVKRFVCGQCGLKRAQIFFCCPKCLSWHSITFRQLLTE